MKNQAINQLVSFMSNFDNVKYKSFSELIEIQKSVYNEFFHQFDPSNDEVILTFRSKDDANAFYFDCHYGNRLISNTEVFYNIQNEYQLILRPVKNVLTLIDSKKPGLVEISRLLNLNFQVEYQQNFTHNTITLSCIEGYVYDLQCHINVSTVLPWMSLGLLSKLIQNETDFNRLNSSIHYIKGELIYESNFTGA